MARNNLKKPIIEMDKPIKGKPIKYWPSSQEAARFYGFNQTIISYNVNGHTTQAKGHYFRFANDKEIAEYNAIVHEIDASAMPAPVEPEIILPNIPVETIPEVIQKPDTESEPISPFEQLLQKSKKKFNENS